jgi:hypothetical protein
MKKLTTEEFIKKAKSVHGNKYGYDKSRYINNHTKIEIYCYTCKEYFWQTPQGHLRGMGCSKCGWGQLRFNLSEFISRAILIHGDKDNYNETDYFNNHSKVRIFCNKHKYFFSIQPSNYLSKNHHRCPKCGKENRAINRTSNTEEFIKKSKLLFGENVFGYDRTNYINSRRKLELFCNKHKYYFWIKPNSNLSGSGCPKCGKDKCHNNKRLTLEEFIEKAKKVHGDRYIYDKFIYIKSIIMGWIGCKIHGYFQQTPHYHLKGGGCPICNSSKGNLEVEKQLKSMNIKYIREYHFKDCKYKHTLPFDFYLPEENICIEYDGEFHFKLIKIKNVSEERMILGLKQTQFHDQIKNKYCVDNNIKLIRIPYWDFDKIEEILKRELIII